ncbi:MAG: beta-lactamase family protein [Theionarchaea archaeon]|nr:beta-lactamase family protein [Theionarchaea archaeon]
MNRGIVVILPLMVSLCITQGNPPIVEESAASGYDFTLLDRYLARKASEHHGMALILVRDGNIIYDKGFAGVTSDTVMPIASASKWLSAGVIMALVDEGMLSLDDRASDYLPKYTGNHGEMTVRQLFSHTSGLPGHYSSTGIPGSDDILGNRSITLAESVDMIAQVELLADPGTQLYYGGLSMQVAGRIAEVASGEDWFDLFEEKIAYPLDMNETDFDGLGPTRNPRIAGSIQTSAHQYARFLQMLLAEGRYNGHQVLSSDAVHEMLKDQTFGVPIVYSPWQQYKHPPPVAQEVRYGIGCWREVIDETGAIKEASSQGAFGFSPWIDVDRNLAGVLAVKSRLTGVMPLYLEMKEIIREIVDTADAKQSSGQGSSPDIQRDFNELHEVDTGPSTAEMIENTVVCDEAREELRLHTTHSMFQAC